jgi:uncharacterized protein YkwD
VIRHRAARWLAIATALTLIGCQQGIEDTATPTPGTAAVMAEALQAPVADPPVHPSDTALPVTTTTAAPEPVPAEMVAPYEPPTTTTTTTTAPPPPPPPAAPKIRVAKAPSAPAGIAPAAAPPAAAPIDSAGASALTSLTNGVRTSAGLAPLARDGSLDAQAVAWAQELASSGRLRHSNIPRSIIGKPWSTVGENVGVGPSVQIVHNALVASSGHYANIVGPAYTRVGIGVAVDASGQVWVCEVFGG